MSTTTGPGTVTKFDTLAEESAASLPENARELAAQAIKAALIAGETQYGFLGGLVNMCVEDADDGKAVLTMDVTPNALNGYGYVHGGMLFPLADYAMGATARTLVEKGASPVTLEAKANYVNNVKEGRLISHCEALHQGKHLITLETRIFSAESKELVMIVTGTFYIIRDDAKD